MFKASFDKANRTSVDPIAARACAKGVRILAGLRREGYAVLTDIHEPAQAEIAAEGADILQIPAFLCRQTDLLLAAGRTGRIVNVKKGQFVAPHDIHRAAEKVASTGNGKVILTERGSSFGYNNLVVDMRGLKIMRDAGWPVVFDATHSVQLPGRRGRGFGRAAAVHRNPGPRGGSSGRQRRLRRSARSAGACALGWPQRVAPRQTGRVLGAPAADPRYCFAVTFALQLLHKSYKPLAQTLLA